MHPFTPYRQQVQTPLHSTPWAPEDHLPFSIPLCAPVAEGRHRPIDVHQALLDDYAPQEGSLGAGEDHDVLEVAVLLTHEVSPRDLQNDRFWS